jgi:hypothetical protein
LIRAYFGILRQLPDGGAARQPPATTPLLLEDYRGAVN